MLVQGTVCLIRGDSIVVNIGIKVPVVDEKRESDPRIDVKDSSSFKKDDHVIIRATKIEFNEHSGNLLEFNCILHDKIEINGKDNIVMVNILNAEQKYEVVGFENFSVEWERKDDPLNLNDPSVHAYFIEDKIDSLLATVEYVDPCRHVLMLSRRCQLDFLPKKSDQIFSAKVIGPLDEKHLLISFSGILLPLHVEDFCYGSPDSIAYLADKLRDHEIDLTWSKGKLSAKHPWHEPGQEFYAQVELTDQQGMLAREDGTGFWVFVPKEELACCELDENLLMMLFPTGEKLHIARIDDEGKKCSLIQNADIQADIEEKMMMKRSERIFYISLLCQNQENRTIARSRSGLLMDFVGKVDTDKKNFTSYVQKFDWAGRNIVLSDAPPEITWDLPEYQNLDELTPRVVEERIRNLKERLNEQGQTAFGSWIADQGCLLASPRNLRLILETVKELDVPLSLDNAEVANELMKIWQIMLKALSKNTAPSSLSGICAFAVGYWHLLNDESGKALPFLKAAANDDASSNNAAAGRSFGVHLALVRAHQLCGQTDEARLLLRKLADRIWINAFHTLPFPLLEPDSDDVYDQWKNALASGKKNELIKIIKDLIGSSRDHLQDLVLSIVYDILKSYFDDDTFIDIEELIRCVHQDGPYGDVNMTAMAAKLSFARGDIKSGWRFLRQVGNDPRKDNDTAVFWNSWLSSSTRSDSVSGSNILGHLNNVFYNCCWSDESFSELWEEYCKSSLDWHLPLPVYAADSELSLTGEPDARKARMGQMLR